MRNQANIREISSNISLDLSILKQFAEPRLKIAEPDAMASAGLNELNNLLKYKNSKYNYSDEHRQREQNWILARNGNIIPLIERSKHMKASIKKKQEQKIRQANSYFYITPAFLKRQNQYIIKNVENSVFMCIQHTQSNRQFRSKISNKFLRGSNGAGGNLKLINIEQNNTRIFSLNERNKKIESYLRAMKNLFQVQQKIIYKQWVVAFKGATKLKLWQILSNLIPRQPKQKFIQQFEMNKMAIYSLTMVEQEFNSILPSNYESILYYITSNYLRKMPGKYENQGNLGPIWAIAYFLYRSGRRLQFYRYLPNQNIRTMFQEADKSIAEANPKKIQGVFQNDDVFHNQLVYALSGKPKYSNDFLCDPNTHDVAWIFLRNVGIFPQGSSKFKQLTQDLCISYRNSVLDQTKVKNLLYLLCFSQLIEIGPNQLMDQYDYLHFLIVLYHSPTFKHLIRNNQVLLNKRLTQRLTQFIERLFVQQKKQVKFYISLIPYESLANQISTLIARLNLINKINWKQFSKQLPTKIYEQLVVKTCKKQVSMHNDYLLAAQKVEDLLNDQQLAINFILQLFIKSINVNKIDNSELKRGQSIVSKIFKRNQRLLIQFGPVFQFFKQYQSLHNLLIKRNQDILYQFLKGCKHILISQNLRIDTENVLQKLISKNGFDSYIQYMKQIVRGYEIALTKMNRIHDLQQVQRMTISALVNLINKPNYKQYAKNSSVIQISRMLNQALYRYN